MSHSLTPQVTLQGATPNAPHTREATSRAFDTRQLALRGHPTVKAAISANLLRIVSFSAVLLAVNLVCGIERLYFYLTVHPPALAADGIRDGVGILRTVFAPVSSGFETFVLWFSTDLMDLGMQNLFDWRHGMMCFLFTVLISVAFFAMGSVIVDRVSKHGEGT